MGAIRKNVVELSGSLSLNNAESGDVIFLSKEGGTNATGILTFSDVGNVNDLITLGGSVYKLVAVPAAPFDVDIGAAATNTIDNLIAAINGAPGEGTLYGVGTIVNTDATAAAGTSDTMNATARVIGTPGNSVPTTENSTEASWGNATLTGGTDTAATSDQTFTLTLPDDAINGTFYTFITRDDGRSLVNGNEIFTDWEITCLTATKSFLVSGNIGGTVHGTREVLNDQFSLNLASTTREILISHSPVSVGQKVNIPYLAGETLELTFFDNVWYGNVVYGSRVRGVGLQ